MQLTLIFCIKLDQTSEYTKAPVCGGTVGVICGETAAKKWTWSDKIKKISVYMWSWRRRYNKIWSWSSSIYIKKKNRKSRLKEKPRGNKENIWKGSQWNLLALCSSRKKLYAENEDSWSKCFKSKHSPGPHQPLSFHWSCPGNDIKLWISVRYS